MSRSIVYLVGAGPGDPGLITLKGLECIKKADVLVYDRLANQTLLSYSRPEAEIIYVGKSPERHTLLQNEINELLVRRVQTGKVVTRLKGGDPFVFGRGGEEAEFLFENNIPFEIVPGITSAVAVPAYAGIPVTHRDFTSSFTVITGHEDPEKEMSSIDFTKLSGSGTLVFLMGMANLPIIAEQLIKHGRQTDTPVAIVHKGTRPEQRTLVGRLDNIADKAQKESFKPPAVIIVGEVVNLRDKLKWFENKPLFGKKILVTRSREQASILSEKIMDLGGEPLEFPTIKIVPPDDYCKIDMAIENISSYNWIVFTSINGVQYFLKRLRYHKIDIRKLNGIKLCAIGPKTKEELEACGLIIDYTPEEYRAEAVVKGFENEEIVGKRILLPRADIAREVLTQSFKDMGALVDDVTMYKTVYAETNIYLLNELLEERMIDIITFTSSSTVRNFVEMLKIKQLDKLLEQIQVASIGPITTATAREFGIKVDIEASEYTIDGMMEAILKNEERK